MTIHNLPVPESAPAQPHIEKTHPPAYLVPIFKLPLILYRIRLGWLLDHLFMQLTHMGRRSGKLRRTVLVVLHYHPQTMEIKVVSAWNASEWYKNIQAAPALQLETGFTRYTPVQRDIPPEELAQLFIDFCRRRPIFSRMVCRIPGWKWDSSYDEFLDLARTLRAVAFLPK